MINNILFIALVVLAVTEVIFAVCFFILMARVKNLKETSDTYKLIMKSDRETIMIIRDAMEKEAETYEHMYELLDNLCDQISSIQTIHEQVYEQYQNILKQYGTFYDSFKIINENYKKLLSCWKDVTTASDNASEQFRLCTEELKKIPELKDLIQRVLDPWVLDSDQLGEAVLHGFSHDYTNVNGVIPTEHIWSRADDPRFAYDINNHPGEEDDEEQ